MQAEQKELYFYTKDHFEAELNRISPECVSPLIVVRQIVKKAITEYCKNYCEKGHDPFKSETPFSPEDFQEVSNKIYNEIMNGEL